MTIQIAGSDLKSRILYENTVKAVKKAKIEAEVVRVTEIDKIATMGVIMTPALAVDNEIRTLGKMLTQDDIISVLKGEKTNSCLACPGSHLCRDSCGKV